MPQAKTKGKASAKQSKQKQPKLARSANSRAIAAVLAEHWPTEAEKIVKVMTAASTSRSMRSKLTRVQRALGNLPTGGN